MLPFGVPPFGMPPFGMPVMDPQMARQMRRRALAQQFGMPPPIGFPRPPRRRDPRMLGDPPNLFGMVGPGGPPPFGLPVPMRPRGRRGAEMQDGPPNPFGVPPQRGQIHDPRMQHGPPNPFDLPMRPRRQERPNPMMQGGPQAPFDMGGPRNRFGPGDAHGIFGPAGPPHPFGDMFGQQATSKVSIKGYDLVEALKTGGMSDAVNLVKEKKSGRLYIEKRVSIKGGRSQRTQAELKALMRIGRKSKNLNYLHDYEWNMHGGFCTFVLEHCNVGSLEDKMKEHTMSGQKFPEPFAWHVLQGVSSGLCYLHYGIIDPAKGERKEAHNTFCHLDLKPCNIFLTTNGQDGAFPRVVLGDFGCVVSLGSILRGMEHPRQQRCGTPLWYPPEGLFPPPMTSYGPPTDVWMLGATIHTMCKLIMRGPDRRMLASGAPCGRSYSERLNVMIRLCTNDDPERRPPIDVVVKSVNKVMRDRGLQKS